MINEVYFIMGGYALMFLLGCVITNFFTGGLLLKILSVKMSRGKGVLLKVHSPTIPYFKKGKLEGGMIRYRQRGVKQDAVFNVGIATIGRSFGVPFLEINEENSAVLLPDWSVVPGHDAQTTDSLMKRIAMLPKRPGNKEIIMLIMIIIILVGVGFCAYKIIAIEKLVVAMNAVATQTVGVIG